MWCRKCQKLMPDEYRFCGNCGEKLVTKEKDRTQETIEMVKSLDAEGVSLIHMAAQTLLIRASMEQQNQQQKAVG